MKGFLEEVADAGFGAPAQVSDTDLDLFYPTLVGLDFCFYFRRATTACDLLKAKGTQV